MHINKTKVGCKLKLVLKSNTQLKSSIQGNKVTTYKLLQNMAEGGAQSRPSDSDEDRGLQELEAELEKIQAQIRAARKKQDRQQALRRQIDAAKKELAAITGEERGTLFDLTYVFDDLMVCVHGLQLRSCRVGQLSKPHWSPARLL